MVELSDRVVCFYIALNLWFVPSCDSRIDKNSKFGNPNAGIKCIFAAAGAKNLVVKKKRYNFSQRQHFLPFKKSVTKIATKGLATKIIHESSSKFKYYI